MELAPQISWPENVWMGVSVENQDYLYRLDRLRSCGAKVKFVSFEPLLGSVKQADITGLDWVIAGGESGPKARPMDSLWAYEIRDICQEQQVPFFFKQWGGVNKKKAGRLLQGRIWDEMPDSKDSRMAAM
jgi:protein gp37